jgi:transcription-repair coupling factor (superfamily II helicase)
MTTRIERDLSSFLSLLLHEAGKQRKRIGLTGLKGSSRAYLLSLLRERLSGPLLVVAPRPSDAESLVEDLQFFEKEPEPVIRLFPEWGTLPYDEIPPHPEIVRRRVKCLFSSMMGEEVMIVSSVKALMQKVLPPAELRKSLFSLTSGEELNRDPLIRFLQEAGYTPAKIVEEGGDYSVRGAIIDIYAPSYEAPLRLEFEGDRVDSIRLFDPQTQRSIARHDLKEVILLPARDVAKADAARPLSTLLDYFTEPAWIFVEEGEEAEREATAFFDQVQEYYGKGLSRRRGILPPRSAYLSADDLSHALERFQTVFLQGGPIAPPGCRKVFPFEMESNDDLRAEMKAALSAGGSRDETSPFSVFVKGLQGWREKGRRVFIVSHTSGQAERLADLLSHYEVACRLERRKFGEALDQPGREIVLFVGPLSSGFQNPAEGWVLLTEEEIFGERRRLGEEKVRTSVSPFSSYRELRENDFIVHIDYGIGLYRGMARLRIGGAASDYLHLEYLDGDRLYVPVDRLNLIQPYVGGDGRPPRLDKLGSRSWERAKKKAKAAVSEMVKELLDLYAARQVFQGYGFSPPDQFYREFEAAFEYEETPDQIKAIQQVMEDMGNPKPMDRLICGDVGYGKTEVAIRAAYRTVMDGKQVAVLVPTTVLAQQHHETFRTRFKPYPVVIEMLSRFKTPREQKEILERLKEGRVDIVIGTHRLLQKDVIFRDLGLLVIDEEHRFGVTHKERLKEMRRLVDVVTLTATPIPRTLQMAVSGIRDLSLIQTAPENRLSIRTSVARYDDGLVREAVQREFRRGGQVFFVHHRVQNIHSMAKHLKKLIPEASLAIAHGQMKERELERVMLQFVKGEFNLLLCTSIIESGLDIPAANTILINHAEQFGLADLYQLRGRVGRGGQQAYAYLLIPGDLAVPRDAMRRLRAIQELSELGSGFKLSMQDLEIRGAGNLLGRTQSGHITAVGYELYSQLMEKAVRELKGEEVVEEITPEIRFHLPAFIPETYVKDPGERLSLYRRLSFCRSEEEVEALREEMADRFGRFPEEVAHLLEVIKVKILLTKLSIRKFEETPSRLVLTFDEKTRVSSKRIVELVGRGAGRFQFTPDSRLIVDAWPDVKKDPFGATRRLLQALA